jgi:hypothetical protein
MDERPFGSHGTFEGSDVEEYLPESVVKLEFSQRWMMFSVFIAAVNGFCLLYASYLLPFCMP